MGRKILLVEDNPDFQEIFVTMAQHLGYEVVRAESGMEGIVIASTERPDVIVMDLMLSGLDGIETTRLLKNNRATRDIPVVVCTALIDDQHRAAALQAGASDYLPKPLGVAALGGTLGKYVV
ncbi:MAG: response regulator [Deltaproteobacteria bacterium]|nr:response regulator [Deltaproteobacteria bacterium]